MSFATLAFAQLFQALNARSSESLFKVGLFSNKYMVMAIAGSLSLQLLVMLVPFLQGVFEVTPLDLAHWEIVSGLALVPVIVGEIQKFAVRTSRPAD
jgi:Ca2+-transporting ATPase